MATGGSAADRPPGPEGLPALGNTHQFVRDRLGFITLTAREYGDVVALELGGESVYHVHHPDHVRQVLVENNEDFVKGEFFQRQLGFLGNGLLNSEGLDYAERVVREAMRLYPPVPGIVREPLPDVEIGGYRIPAGSTVGMFQWVIHRDPRFYDDPKAFIPDRWTESFERELHPFAYFPFGGGPRRCIGDRFALLEARVVLATIIRRFHLELRSEPDLDLSPAITLRPTGGIEMAVHER